MKKSISRLMSILMLMSSFSISVTASAMSPWATDATTGGYILNENFGDFQILQNGDGTACITGYYGKETVLIIPSEIAGLKITEIGENAFSNYKTLTSVTIPQSVIAIGKCAFDGNKNLQNVSIGTNIRKISSGAFQDTKILDDQLTSKGSAYIGKYLIYAQTDPNSNNFYKSKKLVMKDSTIGIADEAFEQLNEHDSGKTKEIVMPNSVKFVGDKAFFGNNNIEK